MADQLKRQSASYNSTTKIAIGLAALWAVKKAYKFIKRKDIEGKVVLITGGSRGLGLAMAMELALKKSRLIIVARNKVHLDKAQALLEAGGCEVLAIQADVSNADEVTDMVEKAVVRFGRIDVLINNAGIMVVGPENVMDIKDYKYVMENNLWSALYTTKAAMPYFQKQGSGHIVNICSIGGKIAVPHMLPYSVSKFAMVALSQGLGNELSKDNIKVTTVIPNLMRTGSPRNISVKGDHEGEYAWFKVADSIPLLSQSARNAAKRIIEAIESGEREITLTLTARVASVAQSILPASTGFILRLINRLLPHSNNIFYKKGYQSESAGSNNMFTKKTDKAAVKYNQL